MYALANQYQNHYNYMTSNYVNKMICTFCVSNTLGIESLEYKCVFNKVSNNIHLNNFLYNPRDVTTCGRDQTFIKPTKCTMI